MLQDDGISEWRFDELTGTPRQLQLDLLDAGGGRQRVRFELSTQPRVLHWDGRFAQLDGEAIEATRISVGAAGLLQGLDFSPPPSFESKRYPMLRSRDALRDEILGAESAKSVDQSP